MIGKLIPIFLALAGLGAGVGGGIALRPDPEEMVMESPCGEAPHAEEHDNGHTATGDEEAADTSHDYVKLNNQFVIPIVDDGRVGSLVVMSLNLEVVAGETEAI